MKCGKRKEPLAKARYYSIPTHIWYGIALDSNVHSVTQISVNNESNWRNEFHRPKCGPLSEWGRVIYILTGTCWIRSDHDSLLLTFDQMEQCYTWFVGLATLFNWLRTSLGDRSHWGLVEQLMWSWLMWLVM